MLRKAAAISVLELVLQASAKGGAIWAVLAQRGCSSHAGCTCKGPVLLLLLLLPQAQALLLLLSSTRECMHPRQQAQRRRLLLPPRTLQAVLAPSRVHGCECI
jgi:hypothetical protein